MRWLLTGKECETRLTLHSCSTRFLILSKEEKRPLMEIRGKWNIDMLVWSILPVQIQFKTLLYNIRKCWLPSCSSHNKLTDDDNIFWMNGITHRPLSVVWQPKKTRGSRSSQRNNNRSSTRLFFWSIGAAVEALTDFSIWNDDFRENNIPTEWPAENPVASGQESVVSLGSSLILILCRQHNNNGHYFSLRLVPNTN